MANYKFVILLLLIIFSCDILDVVEGRRLKKISSNHVQKEGNNINFHHIAHSKKMMMKSRLNNSKSPRRHLLLGDQEKNNNTMGVDVDSFRPTAPGRSPGAGH